MSDAASPDRTPYFPGPDEFGPDEQLAQLIHRERQSFDLINRATSYQWRDLPIRDSAFQHYSLRVKLDQPVVSGNALEYQKGLYAIFDRENHLLGSVATGIEDPDLAQATEVAASLANSHQTLSRFGLLLPEEVAPVEVDRYLSEFANFFSPNGEYVQETGFWIPPSEVPFEINYKLWQLVRLFPEQKQTLYAIIKQKGIPGLFTLWGVPLDKVKGQEIITKTHEFVTSDTVEAEYIMELVTDLYLKGGIATVELREEADRQKWLRYLITRTRALANSVILSFNRPDFSWDFADLSLGAITEQILRVANRDASLIKRDALPQLRQAVWQFFIANASDPIVCDQARPFVEWLFTEDTRGLAASEMHSSSDNFYERLPGLDREAATTTGNSTEFEVGRLETLVGQLRTLKLLPANSDIKMLDLGTHTGERWLRPFLDKMGIASLDVLGTDKLEFVPSDGRWQFLQTDISDPGFAAQVRSEGFGESHLITCLWSVLSDIGPDRWQQALNNMSLLLRQEGVGVIDIPAGYLSEAEMESRRQQGLPIIIVERSFAGPNGEQVSKPFYIAPPDQLISGIQTSGLTILNPPSGREELADFPAHYVSTAGTNRWFLVVKKIGEPKPTPLDLLRQISA